ncbi:MAG: hypothetical protein VW417_05815, partial [Alphaproteobacteria bacterium]
MQGIKAAIAASCSLGQGGNNFTKQNNIFVSIGYSRHSPDIIKKMDIVSRFDLVSNLTEDKPALPILLQTWIRELIHPNSLY